MPYKDDLQTNFLPNPYKDKILDADLAETAKELQKLLQGMILPPEKEYYVVTIGCQISAAFSYSKNSISSARSNIAAFHARITYP